jgi:hypothetical protein
MVLPLALPKIRAAAYFKKIAGLTRNFHHFAQSRNQTGARPVTVKTLRHYHYCMTKERWKTRASGYHRLPGLQRSKFVSSPGHCHKMDRAPLRGWWHCAPALRTRRRTRRIQIQKLAWLLLNLIK